MTGVPLAFGNEACWRASARLLSRDAGSERDASLLVTLWSFGPIASAPATTIHAAMTIHGCLPRVDQVMMRRKQSSRRAVCPDGVRASYSSDEPCRPLVRACECVDQAAQAVLVAQLAHAGVVHVADACRITRRTRRGRRCILALRPSSQVAVRDGSGGSVSGLVAGNHDSRHFLVLCCFWALVVTTFALSLAAPVSAAPGPAAFVAQAALDQVCQTLVQAWPATPAAPVPFDATAIRAAFDPVLVPDPLPSLEPFASARVMDDGTPLDSSVGWDRNNNGYLVVEYRGASGAEVCHMRVVVQRRYYILTARPTPGIVLFAGGDLKGGGAHAKIEVEPGRQEAGGRRQKAAAGRRSAVRASTVQHMRPGSPCPRSPPDVAAPVCARAPHHEDRGPAGARHRGVARVTLSGLRPGAA